MDTCKEHVAQHGTRRTPGTCQLVPGTRLLRSFLAVLFHESVKFPDIRADYFHFPVELPGNA